MTHTPPLLSLAQNGSLVAAFPLFFVGSADAFTVSSAASTAGLSQALCSGAAASLAASLAAQGQSAGASVLAVSFSGWRAATPQEAFTSFPANTSGLAAGAGAAGAAVLVAGLAVSVPLAGALPALPLRPGPPALPALQASLRTALLGASAAQLAAGMLGLRTVREGWGVTGASLGGRSPAAGLACAAASASPSPSPSVSATESQTASPSLSPSPSAAAAQLQGGGGAGSTSSPAPSPALVHATGQEQRGHSFSTVCRGSGARS